MNARLAAKQRRATEKKDILRLGLTKMLPPKSRRRLVRRPKEGGAAILRHNLMGRRLADSLKGDDMSKRIFALAASAFLATAAMAPAASAAMIDTFSFSISSGWTVPLATTIYGQFTGTVEPDGLIELGDLSSFQLNAYYVGTQLLDPTVGNLLFFAYNTGGGASSLGIIDQGPTTIACIGAPSDLVCSAIRGDKSDRKRSHGFSRHGDRHDSGSGDGHPHFQPEHRAGAIDLGDDAARLRGTRHCGLAAAAWGREPFRRRLGMGNLICRPSFRSHAAQPQFGI